MSARGLVTKPTTRQEMVHIRVFLYQDYDIRFYCEAGLHHASFATKCGHDVRKLKNAKRVDLSRQMKKKIGATHISAKLGHWVPAVIRFSVFLEYF